MILKMADGGDNRESDEQQPVENSEATVHDVSEGANGIEVQTIIQAYTKEYDDLDHTLNAIDSWMNKLEEQNDTLSSELDDLLESSKQARKELEEQAALEQQQPMDSTDEGEKK